MCGVTMILLTFLLAALESDEDRALFTEIYEQNHDRMEQTALRILKDSHDAEDAVNNGGRATAARDFSPPRTGKVPILAAAEPSL